MIITRRSMIMDLYAKGHNPHAIVEKMGMPRTSVYTDLGVIKRQARTNLDTWIEKELPLEYQNLYHNTRALLVGSWDIINDEHSSDRSVNNALNVVLDCCHFLRDLLADGTDIVGGVKMYLENQERVRALKYENNQHIEAIQRDKRNSQAIF